MNPLRLENAGDHWVASFSAMASPCQILIETKSHTEAKHVSQLCANEAWRIEKKFSRYIKGNIIDRINRSAEQAVEVDAETAGLIEFASNLYRLSDGLFDITSGVLRQAWNFNGTDQIPEAEQVNDLLNAIGFEKITWEPPSIQLPPLMQFDFGGIGKEYAVDRAVQLAVAATDASCLINFGGDLAIGHARRSKRSWKVGVEGTGLNIDLWSGALATSGDANRYLLKDGVRYSHILNPKTGWPIEHAPHAITVLADTCTQAGMLATLASLQGRNAEQFLEEQKVKFWAAR